MKVDLNADMAEGFGGWKLTEDDALLEIVSSANIACGFHAGDPEIMASTFAKAKSKGVAIGAHPGFPDLWGFGRRRIPFSASEIERLVAYQIGAAQALATYAGHRITYVKAHGALGNIAEEEAGIAAAIAKAVKAVDPALAILAGPLGAQANATRAEGLRPVAEVFADRTYTEFGTLTPRSQPGAMIHDATEAADRVVEMVRSGTVITLGGKRIPTEIESICVHGDSPQSVAMARLIRTRLESDGIALCAFS